MNLRATLPRLVSAAPLAPPPTSSQPAGKNQEQQPTHRQRRQTHSARNQCRSHCQQCTQRPGSQPGRQHRRRLKGQKLLQSLL